MQKVNTLLVSKCTIFHFLSKTIPVVLLFMLSSSISLTFLSSPVSATEYTASLSTTNSVTLSGNPGTVVIDHSEVTVTTNCKAGYNLTFATSVNDNNLYLDGDVTKNAPGKFIAPSDGTTTLGNAPNTWGYLLSPTTPTSNSIFLPVSSNQLSPSIIKTPSETQSLTDIEDSFNIYFGTNIGVSLDAGTYKMKPESSAAPIVYGNIKYYLTLDESCTGSIPVEIDVSFNKNLDGSGSETSEDPTDIVSNFPTSEDNTLNTVNGTITLSNKAPTRPGYIFNRWNTAMNGTGSSYHPGDVITIGNGADELDGNITLYAIWTAECASGYICYDSNGASAGVMDAQAATNGSNVALTPSNFSRTGYGFAGWNTMPDGSGTNYGPGQTIKMPNSGGLNLFARWLKPTGVLQTWAGASSMNVGDVIALEDSRDGEVYTVAKLADNNVWITENLRLVPNTANITSKNTNNPTTAFLNAVPTSSSSTTQCFTDDSACDDNVYFYTGNMDRTKTQSPINNDVAYAWYSYGTMYNWYTATAGHGTNSKSSGSVDGDICPAGWRLPTGGSSSEYNSLATALGGTGSSAASNIRKYPNNFIWSGDYNPSTEIPDGRGFQARLWSSTAQSAAKSYRMGINSSSITPANTWNKWDNFAVRCIYQGDNTPYSPITVDFEGTGITSLTFTSNNYDTETATPANPVINLVKNVAYTVTANLTPGYEVTSWATTSAGALGSSATAPAINPNTYTVTGEATLTATGSIIPTYEVTVSLGEHVTSVGFYNATYGTQQITPSSSPSTVTLYRGVEYTISSSYEDGYWIHEWVTTSNGTLGNATSASTSYTIAGPATLSIAAEEADEKTYILVYNAGSGTDAPDSITEVAYTNANAFTITNSAPIYYGYTFTGWSETADANNNGTTVDYVSGDTITVTSTGATTTKTLYPVYQAVSSCASGKICYYENGADVIDGGRGTMADQTATSNTAANLIPTNYSKVGYGFAGWTTSANATPYGPNATITTPDLSSTGLALYAKWVKSTGNLQTWNGCNSLNTNDVIALTDTRDNETYAVAKLADGKCWLVENLRLVPNTANITSQNTHNPASGFAAAAANSFSSNALCTTDDDSTCINQLQFNTNSLNRSLTQSYNAVSNSVAWYSYGVYYNWYTATAGNGTISTGTNTNVTGDICPKNWHLPTSRSTGEWATLNTVVNGGVSNADAGLRNYPVNLIWSGDYNGSSRTSGYSNGRYWSSTSFDTNNAYRMGHQESGSKGATPSGNYRKWDAFAVRCIYDSDNT